MTIKKTKKEKKVNKELNDKTQLQALKAENVSLRKALAKKTADMLIVERNLKGRSEVFKEALKKSILELSLAETAFDDLREKIAKSLGCDDSVPTVLFEVGKLIGFKKNFDLMVGAYEEESEENVNGLKDALDVFSNNQKNN